MTKPYRWNALVAGVLYLLGTVFGIVSSLAGGEVIASMVLVQPVPGATLWALVQSDASRLILGSFFILLMGLSLGIMTVFLYPLFRRDSPELALGMVLFRGALETAWYMISALGVLALVSLVSASTSAPEGLPLYLASTLSQFLRFLAPTGTFFFLIGATCLYTSFFRTRLIPRWLSVWGLVGVVPYLGYALLSFFQRDNGVGMYLQMVLAPQEMVMALWLIIRGFHPGALERLLGGTGHGAVSSGF